MAIQSFRDFETRRAALLSAVQAAESTQQDAAIAFNEASVRRELAREQVGSAVTALRSAARTLEETSEQFNALKAPLDPSKPHVAAFTTEIKEKFNACDMKAILESIGMMAFCPPVGGGHEGAEGGGATMSGSGVLMAGAQFAAYLQHGVSTIKNAYGVTVDKNDVLQQVNGVNGVGKKLFASAQSIYNDARGFKSDIGSSAILATLDQWEDLVSEFVILESAQPLLADIHALMNATRARGSALISYNVALGDVIDLSATLADTTRVIDESLARVADGNAPELNDQLTFLARQYQEQKDDVIELVYLANRAYAYWRLDDWAPGPTPDGMGHTRNVFRSVMAAGSEGVYAAIDATVLESCHSKLDSWFHHDLSSTPGAPTPMPSLKRTNGFQIFVRDKKLMTELREKRRLFEREVHYVHIDISADGAGGSFTDEHLARLYDYRLTTFRVFLHGAHRETSADHDKLIHMEFIHDSREYNYTATGQRRTYSRPELDVRPFIYDGSRGALRYLKDEPECFAAGFIHTDGDIGCGALDDFAGSGKYPVYAGISPFSQWTIILDPNANKGITFDDELSLEIQLLGSARERR